MQEIQFRNKIVGILKNNVYITHRTKNHFFRKFQGFGCSAEILQELRHKGCLKIMLIYTKVDSSQEIYTTYPAKFYEKGIVWMDEGQDYQRILPLKEWIKRGANNEKNEN